MMDERIEEELTILAERTAPVRGPVFDKRTLEQPISRLSPGTPICVGEGATLEDAVVVMREARIGCVLVVGTSGELVGIFTERDLLLRLESADLSRAIGPYMTPDPETLEPGDPIAFALNLMSVGGFRHVPLVDDRGHPVGVVSVKDVVNYLADVFSQEVFTVPPDPRRAGRWQARDGA
jgi:CBS domain-containing protein